MTNIETPVATESLNHTPAPQENGIQTERTARAYWKGNLKEGNGIMSTQSGVLDEAKYSYKTRFAEGETGTNPEELLAAAHAGCFTMAVASILTKKGLIANSLETLATVTMEGLSVKSVLLSITGNVPGINASEFSAISKDAEKTCIISKVLNIPITSESHIIE